jgi:hypothetical protein
VKELQERIDDAIFFLETEYNTYPSGEAWRKALKKILEGNKIKKLNSILRINDLKPPYDENLEMIWKNIIIQQNKINEIIDKLEEIE